MSSRILGSSQEFQGRLSEARAAQLLQVSSSTQQLPIIPIFPIFPIIPLAGCRNNPKAGRVKDGNDGSGTGASTLSRDGDVQDGIKWEFF